MDIIATENFGKIPSPDNFNELLSLINENKKTNSAWNVSYWRGQANIDWRIDSGAVRRLKKSRGKIEENDICYYEEYLINKAKKNLFNYEGNRYLTDFELLTKLQHHGAATRFVDFSKNALIGLFFCTQDKKFIKDYGVLIAVDTHIVGGSEGVFDFNMSYNEFKSKIYDHIMLLDPPVVTNRISAQHAVLLHSKYVDGRYGSLFMEDEDKYYKIIAISPELKIETNHFLTSYFDITLSSMFPDLSGFCSVHSTDWEIYDDERW